MADFFGGSLSDFAYGLGDSTTAFFDRATNPAYSTAAMGRQSGSESLYAGAQGQEQASRLSSQDDYSSSFRGFADPFQYKTPYEKDYGHHAADFDTIEQGWLRRLRRFSDIDTQTSVKEGSK
jgi:hypothetical protein